MDWKPSPVLRHVLTSVGFALAQEGGGPEAGFSGIEDPSLGKTSAFALIIRQQISLVRMTREMLLSNMQSEEMAA